MNVRRAQIGDETILRALRVQALTEDPDAFGSTLDRELARTVDDWRRWMAPGVTFIVENDAGPRGIVAAAPDSRDPRVVQLMAMWVHPDVRRSGCGDALVAAVIAWAAARGAVVVRLDVVRNNRPAIRLYERNGFVPTGQTRLRDRDGAIELEMEWALQRSIA